MHNESKHTNDDLFKKIANEYVEHYGTELQRELDELEQVPGATISELEVEKRVRKRIAAQKRRRYMPMIATLAACVVIAFIFIIPNLFDTDFVFPAHDVPAPTPEAPAPAPEAAAPEPPSAPMDPAPAEPAPAPEPPSDAVDAFEPEPPPYEIIPLPAPLPDGFYQVGFEQYNGTSIYFIEDEYGNEIVIMLEITDVLADFYDMDEIDIGGHTAFAKQTDTYSLLIGLHDNVQFTLTGEHDIDILIKLASVFVGIQLH